MVHLVTLREEAEHSGRRTQLSTGILYEDIGIDNSARSLAV